MSLRPPGIHRDAVRPEESVPPPRRRPRHRRRWVLLAILVLLALPVTSYIRALTYPGQATWSERSVEWVRDHGGGGVVDAVENWYYSRQQPSATGRPQDIPSGPAAAPGPGAGRPTRSPVCCASVRLVDPMRPLTGEGSWHTTGAGGVLWTTWFRPDPAHLPVTVAAVVVPVGKARLHLMPGTREPVPGLVPVRQTQVPAADRHDLLATFNGGFKTQDSRGGWYANGRMAAPLREGRASLVIYRSGAWQVGAWGATVPAPTTSPVSGAGSSAVTTSAPAVPPGPLTLTRDVVAVRQNLNLIIDHGAIVPGLKANSHGLFGTSHTQFQYTWRSGVGTDAHGDLVYVAGGGLTLASLAEAMWRAGVVEGMQLDIHTGMVIFDVIDHQGPPAHAHRLLPAMHSSRYRYLKPDQRDFFYLTAM